MLTEKLIPRKIEFIEKQYEALRFEKVAEVPMEMTQTREHLRAEPARARWARARAGTKWGGSGITAWFRGDVKLPASCRGRRVFLRAVTGANEAMLWVNARAMGVFDPNHPVVLMTMKGRAGKVCHVALEAYSGHDFPNVAVQQEPVLVPRNSRAFQAVEVLLERSDVTQFVFDLRVLRQLASSLEENSLRRNRIMAGLADVHAIVDALPRESGEESWRPGLVRAGEILRPLLKCRNGSTTPFFGLVGHSHIDTAWLWTLQETWRKCARTFSSMVNLMEQYPEVVFVQPAPCHAERVRKEHPGLFRRMKKLYDQGRWEPNGAMWVEPDCNITGGESLIRQILVGVSATRDMFDGYRSDTLWLPDVFGYSAALPQILRGSGVRYFCTSKIGWNDTTRFPYDTFHWKGIDGTTVLTHFNRIHCAPDVETLRQCWDSVQHKDVQDRCLFSFGYGDGGGGPHAEMMETARRLGDLEGCPRTAYTTVTRFMDSLRRDLSAALPAWQGELYLEGHRGTLTSIAKIKRGNRQAEVAMREAEFLCTLGALRGRKYPAGRALELWKDLLTHQFHDILPGTSIAEVNDEAVEAFRRIRDESRELAADGAGPLLGKKGKSDAACLVCNSLSWDRSAEMTLSGIQPGMTIAVSSVTSQRVKDIEGHDCLVVSGLTVPALGAVPVDLVKEGRNRRTSRCEEAAPWVVSRDRRGRISGVETEWVKTAFDDQGRISSFLDRSAHREIVAEAGTLNSFQIAEDVPTFWDNWDIERDILRKFGEENRLLSREVVAQGPVQLRIRSRYRIGRSSTLAQDMIFHATSRRVDFETLLDWSETHRFLKVGFNLSVRSDYARHEIQYGHVSRPTHTNLPQDRARFEVAAHKWTDLSDEGYGVALLNDCKYGVSVEGSTIRLSLMKSGTHPDARGDAGRHRVTYSLLPHGPFGVESVVRPAYELNVPVSVFRAAPGTQTVPSLLRVDPPDVIVEAVKWAEDGRGFVVRLYEAGNQACRARLRLGTRVRSAHETNLLEESRRKLALKDQELHLSFRPFEIKTLVFRP